MVGGVPDKKAAHQGGEEPTFSWLGMVLVLLGFAATTVGFGLIAWSAKPGCWSWDRVDFVDLASGALRFVLTFSGVMAMAIGMVHAFPTADKGYQEMVLMGLLAIAGGFALVVFSEGFMENTVGLLMLVTGGLFAMFGTIRIVSRELLYGGEKEREGKKEGGEG